MNQRVILILIGIAGVLLVLLVANTADAQKSPSAVPEEQGTDPGRPTLLHNAPTDAFPNEELVLTAVLDGPWDTSDIRLACRSLDDQGDRSGWQELSFRRRTKGDYRVVVPAQAVAYPGLEYAIFSVRPDGTNAWHFASRDRPHRVVVLRDSSEQARQRRLGYHGGRVHSAGVDAKGVWFGTREKVGRHGEKVSFDDYLWNVEANYTYRLLGPLYSISFGAGSLRGVGEEWGFRERNGTDPPKPGIDYGYSAVRFAIIDWILLTAEVRLGADERGFVGGVGGYATVGRPTGTHLDFGGDWTYGVGYRAFLEFSWDTVPYCVMSLRGELTNWPDEAHTATIASFNTAIRVHPLAAIKLSVGFAGRHGEAEAGLMAGLGTEFYF